MDTLQTIINLIKDLGFPIAVCIAMFWLNNKQVEQHKEEMAKLSEALNNNTLAINKLNERLNHGED